MNPQDSNLVDVTQNFTGLGNSNPVGLAQSANAGQPTPQQPKPNWLERLLPTIGSVAAPLIGAALAPETGGLSLLAGAALSGLGAGTGKVAENAFTGQGIGQGVAGEAAGSALGAGVMGGVLGGIGKLGGKVLGSNVVQKGIQNTGSDLLQGAFGQGASKADAQTLYNLGINDAKDFAERIHPAVGGADGAMSKGVIDTLNSASKKGATINLSQFEKVADNQVGKEIADATNGVGIGDGTTNQLNVQKFVSGQLQRFNNKQPLRLGQSYISPQDLAKQDLNNALDMSKAMDKRASEFLRSGNPDVKLQGAALRNLSHTIKDQLYGASGVVGGEAIPQEVRAQIVKDLGAIKDTNPSYHNAANNVVNDPKSTIGDLRSFNAPGTRLSIAHENKINKLDVAPGKSVTDVVAPIVGMQAAGPVGLAAGLVIPKAAESETARKLAIKATQKAAGVSDGISAIQKKITASPQLSKIQSLLGKLNKTATAGGVAGSLPGLAAQPANNNQGANMNQQPMGMGGQTQQPITELFKQLLTQEQAGAGLTDNSQALISALSSLAPQAQQTQLMGGLQGGLQQGFANSGGAQGLFGGLESNALGLIPGTAQNQYRRNQNIYGSILQKLYGIPAGQGAAFTPQFTQAPTTAGISAQALGY